MDPVLLRWSTAAQVTSLVVVAAFFLALARSTRRAEVRWWAAAFCANAAAVAVAACFWSTADIRPSPRPHLPFGAYAALKAAFALSLLQGTWAATRPDVRLPPARLLLGALLAFGGVVALVVPDPDALGVVEHSMLGLLLIGGTLAIGRQLALVPWLATGLLLRGLLAWVEVTAFWLSLDPVGAAPPLLSESARRLLPAAPWFDAGAEWFIALGCVLAVSERAQHELAAANAELLRAQDHLRRLADRDPLTALENRRALPEIFRRIQPGGGSVLFFDLDGFKLVNDRFGHAVGDRCLVGFADAVRASFRPCDAVVRYGGDEFLVVAPGMDTTTALERVAEVRARLNAGPEPRLSFACGLAALDPAGSPAEALAAADRAMYQVKRRVVVAVVLAILASASAAIAQPAAGSAAPPIDAGALMASVRALASPDFAGRAPGTDGHARARAWILQRFRSAGLTAPPGGFEQSFRFASPASGGRATTGVNVVGVCPGTDAARPVIVVSAHYDHLGVRDGRLYPGADDNASGVAVLLELAAICVRLPFRHTIAFAALDAEESGLHGARAFLAAAPVDRRRLALNVNLDMVARGDRGELFAAGLFHYPGLRPLLAPVAGRAAVRLRFGHDRPGSGGEDWTLQSDHAVFHEAGIPFVYFGVEDHADYHQPSDTADRIAPAFFAAAAAVILDALRALDLL